MIVKKVPDPKHSASVADRIRALTNYIVRPELTDPAEKCLYAGARGFFCADLRDQQNEMIGLATAPRRASNPIIHYVLSWHEDEVPTSQDIEEAVDLFLGNLGLAECQAIYGLHVDTSNAHLHICVNRVDPVEEKLIRINGGFDLEAAHQAIAIIEEHQGWRRETNARYVASGPNVYRSGWDAERPEISAAARDKELRTGEISAELKAHHVLKLALESAPNWAEFHRILGRAGMVYRSEGNGAVIVVDGVHVKASKALRAASWSKLVKHFGAYEEATVAPRADPYFRPWLDERREATCAIIGKGESNQSLDWHTVDGFEAYRVDGRTYYSRRRGGAVSFVDEGERIRVLDSRDEEAARAALKLAATKWPDGIQIEGSADFKRLMVRIAVQEGITIGNPELQADIKKEQAIRNTKIVTFANGLDLKKSVTQLVVRLGSDRYEVLVPGRTRPGEKAQGAQRVLASPDGRGFTTDAVADAIHDAVTRGAKPAEINLVPLNVERDYLVSYADAARQASEDPIPPGPASLPLAFPDGQMMAVGSVHHGDRLALHQLASELARKNSPDNRPKKGKRGNPRPDLARHAVPIVANPTTTIGTLNNNPALEARRDALLTLRQNTRETLAEIGLEPVRLLRSAPEHEHSTARIDPQHDEAIARFRADVMQDFPCDQRTHPSRVDAMLALRLRAMGATRNEIAEGLLFIGAAAYQVDPYVTPNIYADRLADYAVSPAADDWARNHQHLAEVWQAIIHGAQIPWPSPETTEPSVDTSGIHSGHPAPSQPAITGGPDVEREPKAIDPPDGQPYDQMAPHEPAQMVERREPVPAHEGLSASGIDPIANTLPRNAYTRPSEVQKSEPVKKNAPVENVVASRATAEEEHAPQKAKGSTAHANDFCAMPRPVTDALRGEIELSGMLDQPPTQAAGNIQSKSGGKLRQPGNVPADKNISTDRHKEEVSSGERSGGKTIETHSLPPGVAPAAAISTTLGNHSTSGPARSASPAPTPPAHTESNKGGDVANKATTERASARAIGREPLAAEAKPTEKPAPAGLTAPAKTQAPKPTERPAGPSMPQATEQHKDPASHALRPHLAKRQGPGTDGPVQPKPDQGFQADPAKHAEVNTGVPSPPPVLSRASGPASASNTRSAANIKQPGPVSRQNQETTKAPGVAESSSPSSVAPKPGTPAPAPTPPPSGLPTVTPATEALPSAGPMAEATQKERPPLGNSTPTDPPSSSGARPSEAGKHPHGPSLSEMMKSLPREVPILLEASHRRGFDPGDDQPAQDPLAPVKRLALMYPNCLVPTPPGNDETFEISSNLDVEKAMQTALAKGSAEAVKTKALIDKSVLAISMVIKSRWQELAKGSQCALYPSEPNSPLRALVRLWLDHRRALDQSGIKESPDDAYRAHWVGHRVRQDLAALLLADPSNPITNWRVLKQAFGMTIVAELTLTARKPSAKTYAGVLAAAREEAGLIRVSQASSAEDRSIFPPILPSMLRPDQRKALVLAARLDAHNQHTLTDKLLARDPVLRALHEFARQAIEATPPGPDRESLAVAIKATRQATLERPFVEGILQPLGAPPNLINRILDQASNKGRQR